MRLILALLAVLGLVAGSAAVTVPAMAAASDYVLAAEQQPPVGDIQVNINTDEGAWFANPLWIGIGVVAVIALIAIIAMASRNKTTIIKD